jgi:hypothetical protein
MNDLLLLELAAEGLVQILVVAGLYLWIMFKLRGEIRVEVASQRGIIRHEADRLEAELTNLRASLTELHARFDRMTAVTPG